MKIIAIATFSMLHSAAAVSGGPKKPARKGTVLAGGGKHRDTPHSRRTTALTHSESHRAAHRRATATHTKAHHAEPRTALRASTRGGAAASAGTSVKTKDPTSAPVSAPAPVFSPSSFSSFNFDIFSPTSGEELPCPPPQEMLDQLGLTAPQVLPQAVADMRNNRRQHQYHAIEYFLADRLAGSRIIRIARYTVE